MIKKLGTFTTKTKKLRISDPCYDKNVWCCGTLNNCETGTWSSFIIYSDEGQWGVRVAENFAVFGDVTIDEAQKIYDESNWKDSKITVGVDSVQCGIFDDSEYPDGDTGDYGDNSSFYGKCCNATLNGDNQGNVIRFGTVSRTGFGDGSYECFFTGEDNISAIRVVFIENFDNLEEEE